MVKRKGLRLAAAVQTAGMLAAVLGVCVVIAGCRGGGMEPEADGGGEADAGAVGTADGAAEGDGAGSVDPDGAVGTADGAAIQGDGGGSWVAFVAPTHGSRAHNPVSFRVDVDDEVVRVAYEADGWPVGESEDPGLGFAVGYLFDTVGERNVTARGYDVDDVEVAAAVIKVTVWDGAEGVPYFYQYDNAQYPGGTCQNTSIAMVLGFFGWTGVPDEITTLWGKDYAQSPSGLADVFNYYAAQMGIPQRFTAHVDGTFAEMRALLRQAKPVVVHGYFTAYGHVVVVTGYDGTHYIVNDPAGEWTQTFAGGYPGPYDSVVGQQIRYEAAPFEQAVATSDGQTSMPLWYHEITP